MSALPSTVHYCGKCRAPSYLPTVAVALAVEKEPPKRGDPIAAPLDGSPRNCGFCGLRIVPRRATVATVEAPPPPPRGAPVPLAVDGGGI